MKKFSVFSFRFSVFYWLLCVVFLPFAHKPAFACKIVSFSTAKPPIFFGKTHPFSIENLTLKTENLFHEFHTSLAEMHYNTQSKSLEVSLRVFSDDLENALGKANNRTVRVDATDGTDLLIKQYLAKNFSVIDSKNNRKPLTWVGKEIAVDVTWLYFEIPLTEDLTGLKIQNSVLCEVFEDQVNIVNVNYRNQKRTYLFKPDQTMQALL